jgi:hypothetical protein
MVQRYENCVAVRPNCVHDVRTPHCQALSSSWTLWVNSLKTSFHTTMPVPMWPTLFRTNWLPCSGRCFQHASYSQPWLTAMWFSHLWTVTESPLIHVRWWHAGGCGTVAYVAAQGNICRQNTPPCTSVGLLYECLWWLSDFCHTFTHERF